MNLRVTAAWLKRHILNSTGIGISGSHFSVGQMVLLTVNIYKKMIKK